ncbi:carbon-nitrogen hydrolase family protein [Micropruina sonneratiae]|uniref:carbon-nitrogen hydrolase family protein n=1 Tax=Micropruina sonneratiae TaxID=2986940 RepID=UPI00222653C8|nr:carbon-nitrogen hydrolase family protein [Micropruina sp. KQZ13P-5]MCW3158336.1 carbon-nitrogen hydrolase family protein [Micropruina sp. KQZ13P-5]
MSLRLAACQFSATPDPASNLGLIRGQAAEAAAQGATVVVCPEASMVPFGSDLAAAAEPLDGAFADGVRALAQQLGVLLVVGMFTPSGDGRVCNTLLIAGRGVETSYDKIHLFDAFGSRESDTVAPGSELVTFAADGVTFGVSTCFDLRFAAQFTELGRRGAEVLLVPASWGEGPGKADQWDLLVRARATDAQAWLLACDQAWTPPAGSDPLGIGRSACVDPLGVVRAALSGAPGVLVCDVDPSLATDVRGRVPVL